MTVAITLRSVKGSELDYVEMDDNLTNLKDQAEENDHKSLTVTANYTAIADYKVILVDATAGPVQIDLLAAANVQDMIFYIKKIDSSGNAVTVAANGAETIEGNASLPLAAQYDLLKVISDGTTWYIL